MSTLARWRTAWHVRRGHRVQPQHDRQTNRWRYYCSCGKQWTG